MIARLFTDHPRAVGESYFQHLGAAALFGLRLVAAGAACIAHGLFPFLFKTTGSEAVRALHTEMRARRRSAADGEDARIRQVA